jgi:hypothetical protein
MFTVNFLKWLALGPLYPVKPSQDEESRKAGLFNRAGDQGKPLFDLFSNLKKPRAKIKNARTLPQFSQQKI